MFNNFLMQGMLKRAFGNIPEEEQQRIMGIINRHPELFVTIGKSMQEKIAAGKNQTEAAQEAMQEHQAELAAILKED